MPTYTSPRVETDIAADALAAGHATIYRVIVLNGAGQYGRLCHYWDADPSVAAGRALDMAASEAARGGLVEQIDTATASVVGAARRPGATFIQAREAEAVQPAPSPRPFAAFMREHIGDGWYLAARRSSHPRFEGRPCVTPKAYAKLQAAWAEETAERIGRDPIEAIRALLAVTIKGEGKNGPFRSGLDDAGQWMALERILQARGLPVAYA